MIRNEVVQWLPKNVCGVFFKHLHFIYCLVLRVGHSTVCFLQLIAVTGCLTVVQLSALHFGYSYKLFKTLLQGYNRTEVNQSAVSSSKHIKN